MGVDGEVLVPSCDWEGSGDIVSRCGNLEGSGDTVSRHSRKCSFTVPAEAEDQLAQTNDSFVCGTVQHRTAAPSHSQQYASDVASHSEQ